MQYAKSQRSNFKNTRTLNWMADGLILYPLEPVAFLKNKVEEDR